METKLGWLVKEERWPRDSGHHTPTVPWGSCCSFLLWYKTLLAQIPWWDTLACSSSHSSSSWDAAGCCGNLIPIMSSTSCPPSPQPPAATQGPEEEQTPHTDHHVPVPLPCFHLSPKPACSPPPLLAVPVLSPFLQTPVNSGWHFPGPAPGMNCALLFWQVSFSSPSFPAKSFP